MEDEVGTLQEVARSTSSLEIEGNSLLVNAFGIQLTSYDAALKRYHAAQAAIKGVVYLVKANPELASAVEAVKKLGELFESGFDSLANAIDQIKNLTTQGRIPFETSTWAQLFLDATQNRLGDPDAALYMLSNMVTRDVVEQKDGEIKVEYAKIKLESSLVGLGVILLAESDRGREVFDRSFTNIGEITQGLAEISRMVNDVAAQADRLGQVGDDLDQAVNAFQTENDPDSQSLIRTA